MKEEKQERRSADEARGTADLRRYQGGTREKTANEA